MTFLSPSFFRFFKLTSRAGDELTQGPKFVLMLLLAAETCQTDAPKQCSSPNVMRRCTRSDTLRMLISESTMTDEKQRGVHLELRHSDFFVLRTPLLPIRELTEWSETLTAGQVWEKQADANALEDAWKQDVNTLRARLLDVVARPEILYALYIASPSLQTGIEHWKRDPDSKKGVQAERALVRYFARMCARSTPFGLFSGCSVGQINSNTDTTKLILENRSQYRLCCRLDFDYLFALTTELRKDPALEMELQYWPNTSLHKVADVWYYTESRLLEGAQRTHHLVKVDSDAYLDAAIERARSGATVSQLVQVVLAAQGEADPSEDEAREYVLGLIRDNEILTSNLSPLLTGTPPLDDIIHSLESLPSGAETAIALREIQNRLSILERRGFNGGSRDYEAITSELEKLPAKVDPARLYQVDMIKPVKEAVLGKAVITELIRGVELLCRLGQTNEPEELKSFRESFSARYELAMIPLMDALDEESGIGFGLTSARSDASPLLHGLHLDRADAFDWKKTRLGVHPALFRQLIECMRAGKPELELDLSDLEKEEGATPKLADAFCLVGTLVATSSESLMQGDFEFILHGGYGPSGARMLGRFCHEDPQIEHGVRQHLQQEEMQDPEAVYAEVVYLPEGRVGNVLCRPVLREYEIPFLGRSGAPRDRQLPLSDLLVAVEGSSIVLYSRRLGRRVVPRLTNAHGFMNPQLSSAYRFLCNMQYQHGVSVPSLSWGALEAFDYLPRVRVGPTVLCLARWRLSRKEIESVGKEEGSQRFVAMQKLRKRRGLPRWVVLQEGDNSLPVDLENALSVDSLVHVLKRGSEASLAEMYPPPDRQCASSPEGSFHHELHVSFTKKAATRTSADPAPGPAMKRMSLLEAGTVGRDVKILPPGSEWLYVKLYGGAGTLDDILATAVLSLVRNPDSSGSIARWFFIRYRDPHNHLRIRFNGNPERLRDELLPLLAETFNPLLSSGKLWKIEFDTYQREIERYGGLDGLLAAEDVFFADSEAVLDILRELEGDEGMDMRWRIGLMGIDQLLCDFGFDDIAKRELVGQWRDSFRSDFRTDMIGKRQLGDRFRRERRELETLLNNFGREYENWTFAKKALERRSARNTEVAHKLLSFAAQGKLIVTLPDLVSSYTHMHINRLIRASQRAHEFVLYDFLFQLYDSRLARTAQIATRTRKF